MKRLEGRTKFYSRIYINERFTIVSLNEFKVLLSLVINTSFVSCLTEKIFLSIEEEGKKTKT